MGATTTFYSRPYTQKISELTTVFSENAEQLVVGHVIQQERPAILHKYASTVFCEDSLVILVSYIDREMRKLSVI